MYKYLRKTHRGVPNWVWAVLVVMSIFVVIYGIVVIAAPKTENKVLETPPPSIIQPPIISSPICGNLACEDGELISCPQDCGEPR